MHNRNDRFTALKQSSNASLTLPANNTTLYGTDPPNYALDQVQFGDTLFYSYEVNDDPRGELFRDVQLLQDVNALKTVYRRMKMYGITSSTRIADENATRSYSFEIHLPENTPPRALMIMGIEQTKTPTWNDDGLKTAFTKPTGLYFLKMDNCLISITAVHNGKTRYFKAFERMALSGKLFGVEDNAFTYKQWLDQIPAIVWEYDSSQADIVTTARTGQLQSVLQVTIQINPRTDKFITHWATAEPRFAVLAIGDEYLRKADSTAPYQVLTSREVIQDGMLVQGGGFIQQNTANIATRFGFDQELERARSG